MGNPWFFVLAEIQLIHLFNALVPMLIPKESPYLSGLNSFYLHVEKCVVHLQGEIGSGGLYCYAPDQELFVFFDEHEIVRTISQIKGKPAVVSTNLETILQSVTQKSYQVTVYFLDANSIFFWGQMPPFQRATKELTSADITLPDLVFRLRQKKFTGFIDVDVQGETGGAVLFYRQGEREGGSYSWGHGGLSPSNDDYNQLLGLLQENVATYRIGHFKENTDHQKATLKQAVSLEKKQMSDEVFSGLDAGVEAFLGLFVFVAWKKLKGTPLNHLMQKIHDSIGEFPVLDPFNHYYEISETGAFRFLGEAPKEEITSAIVEITWQAVNELKLQKKFRAEIRSWSYRDIFESMGLM